MRKTILVYGDSNSWGYLDDGSGIRTSIAWPRQMAHHLAVDYHKDIHLIEECLPGRTAAYADPREGPEYNGLPYLRPALLSHAPIDMVLIMLGTNDFKARFEADETAIANNLVQLAKIIRRTPAGPGKWREGGCPLIGIIAPALLGRRVTDAAWMRAEEWHGAYDKSCKLFNAIKSALVTQQTHLPSDEVFLFNAGDIVIPSEKDPIHWPASEHLKMGEFMAAQLAAHL